LRHALDAWALIAYLDGEQPALRRIRRMLRDERPLMSWINVGEVAYTLERRQGREQALETLADVAGGLTLDEPSPARVLVAASIKAQHPVSYADAFAVATAQAYDAVLLTGDPEILDAGAGWRTEDLRGAR
jgi:predicted nucleic acid-binding protein